ncbi:hypothetical protein CRYUN_Cryun09bG0168300 [Craigia yunnanensis]
MILLQNCAEFVFSFIGASMIGAVSTTANPFYIATEIFKQFEAARAKLIVTQSQYVDKFKDTNNENFPKIGEDFKVITIDDPLENCLHFTVLSKANENEIPQVSIDPDDLVALPFSSGTTGLPKGVKFEIGALLELIQRYKVSVAAVVPPLVLALVKNPMVAQFDLSSIRVVLSGAAPLGKELEEALKGRVPQAVLGIWNDRGRTSSIHVPRICKAALTNQIWSCGTVVRNAELKVIDPETGCSLGYNQPGEICIRGFQIMKGYLNDTAAAETTIDVEGWLHTGDIGYVDEDDEIFIVDKGNHQIQRLPSKLISPFEFLVPPAELESLLVSHPSIADAAVVPYPLTYTICNFNMQKEEVAGEVPIAFVVRSNGFELTEEAVKEFIAKQVVVYKRLHKVHFVHAIPKSSAGKISRKDLRAKLVAAPTILP